jgi:hypothetical protein
MSYHDSLSVDGLDDLNETILKLLNVQNSSLTMQGEILRQLIKIERLLTIATQDFDHPTLEND